MSLQAVSSVNGVKGPPYENRRLSLGGRMRDGIATPSGSRAHSVWLMCPDAALASIAARLERRGGVIVIRMNGESPSQVDSWDCDQTAHLDDAVSLPGVRELVVCGHADCSMLSSRISIHPEDYPERGISKLIRRVALRQAAAKAGRERLLQQVQTLSRSPAVARAIAEKGLTVCGMWYIPETGLWMRFVPEQGWTESLTLA